MTDARHIYYNYRIDNFRTGTNALPKRAKATVKTGQILNRQSDYKVSLEFFNIRAFIPVFICPIVEGTTQNNINLTPFGVCFTSTGGTNYPEQLIYVPSETINVYQILPRSPQASGTGLQDLSNTYYYVWAIENFLDMINTTLRTAYTAFNAANPAIHTSAPFFQFNAATGLFELVAEESYVSHANKASVFINAPLQQYLDNFQYLWTANNDPNFKDFQLIFKTGNLNQYAYLPTGSTAPATTIPPLAPAAPYFIKIPQEYQSLWKWCNIRSILIKSTSIATRDEYLPAVINPLFAGSTLINAGNPPSQNVISFFDIIVGSSGGTGANWRENLYLQPQVLRWMDLVENGQLNAMDIELAFQLTNGVVLPLYIPINEAIDIKFRFQKKLVDD